MSARVPRPRWGFRVVAWVVIAVIRLLRWRVHTIGLDNVPDDRGAVIAWNHHSYLDFLVTAWDLYRRLDRPVRFLAKREVWESPWTAWAPRLAQAIPVDRGSLSGRRGALDEAVTALQEGHLVMVAPEGTISPSFELMRFATGAARMAAAAGVPLVPSVSWGSHRAATAGHIGPRNATGIPIIVRFGDPLEPTEADDARAVTDKLRSVMDRMLDEVQRTYPDGTPAGAWWVPRRLGGGAPSPGEASRGRRRRGPSRGR